jgi:nucleoside-triphosphatase
MTPLAEKHHILLITGTPGIGKTTLLRKVAAALPQYRIGGFYTEEIREAGVRQGFRLIGFNHERGVIAHIDIDHRYRVGKYGVDVAAIDRLAASTLDVRDNIDFYLIDEIGKMECLSDVFVSRMRSLLDSEKTVVATVGKKGGGLIEQVKHWSGSDLWEITHTNRDALATDVTAWLREQL